MKNQEFQLKLLVRQNTQMALKLQNYRRDNQQLSRKNQSLNTSVQNLSQVFASLSAAWRTITDNEQALYTLMKKKSDNSSKALVNKYISHFKAFDQIISNLGEKITNEGHSEAETLDAKQRLASFVNNYNLFFMELIQAYFKFNQEYISFLNEKLQQPNLQTFTKNLIPKELDNRHKIKDFQLFVTQLKENMKVYDSHNKHVLLDGLVLHKNKEIEALKELNMKQGRKIAFMTDYNTQNINRIIQEDIYQCFCGGVKLTYFSQLWEQNLKKDAKDASKVSQEKIHEQEEENPDNKHHKLHDLELQNRLLLDRNVQALSKIQKMKNQSRLADEYILQSGIYLQLRAQFSQLVDYTNELTLKLNKHYELMNQLQRLRLQQIEELKKKHEKRDEGISKSIQKEESQPNKYVCGFKHDIQLFLKEAKDYFWRASQKSKEREQSLSRLKESLKGIKRQNDEMNKKLGDYQQKTVKSIEHMEYRYPKYSQLEQRINELLSKDSKGEDGQRVFKLWQQFVDYVKNRDKKIKAMEDQMRKKDKEINQKGKIQQFLKNLLSQTELTYVENKEKFDKVSAFQSKMQKDIVVVSEQNYKMKISIQQQRNSMQQKIRTQLQGRSRMQEKVKLITKIEEEVKTTKQKQTELVSRFNEYMAQQKQKICQLKLQIKEIEKQRQNLALINSEKDRSIEKAIEEKEKKNLQINKLKLFLKAIEQKTEYEAIKMEMQEYKSKIMCRCGAERERSIVLKTCPHIFCKKCIQDLTTHRNRKCPMCGVKFTNSDIHEISWC